jgi:hypothetical protein
MRKSIRGFLGSSIGFNRTYIGTLKKFLRTKILFVNRKDIERLLENYNIARTKSGKNYLFLAKSLN